MIKFLFLILLILIIILLVYFLTLKRTQESFYNFQRLLFNDNGSGTDWNLNLRTTPLKVFINKPEEMPSYMITGDNNYQNKLLIKTISHFFKFKKDFFEQYQKSFNYTLNKVSLNKSDFGIIDEMNLYVELMNLKINSKENNIYKSKNTVLSNYSDKDYYSNIRSVCSLYSKYLTFLCRESLNIKSSYQINNKKIGVIRNSSDLTKLEIYFKAINNKTNTIILFDNLDSLFKGILTNKIQVLFICCAHPSPYIIHLSKKVKITIIDCQTDFKSNRIAYFLPLLKKKKISLKEYNIPNMINFLSFRNILISNPAVSKWIIYQFLYNYFNNINYVDANTNYIFKEDLKYNNIFYLNKVLTYHEGAILFYKNQGFIF